MKLYLFCYSRINRAVNRIAETTTKFEANKYYKHIGLRKVASL